MRSFDATEDINCQIFLGNLEWEPTRDLKSGNNLNKLTEKFGWQISNAWVVLIKCQIVKFLMSLKKNFKRAQI